MNFTGHRLWAPTPRTLTATISDQGFLYPGWLSADGAEIWSSQSTAFYRSLDNGDNWGLVKLFDLSVRVVRELPSGQLIVGLQGIGEPGEIWVSSGYTRANPTAATWAKTDTCSANGVYPEWWGMDVHADVIVYAEYGATTAGANGRRVRVSEDQGQTWRTIFSWVGNPDVNGDGLHIHGCAYDPYADRIWIACGDAQSGIAYSDNWQDPSPTWTWYSTGLQPVSISPMPDSVVFGMDDPTNGIYVLPRDRIGRIGFKIETDATLVTIAGQPYRKGDGYPLLLGFGAVPGATRSGVLLATYDGLNFHRLWTDSITYTGQGLTHIFGPTADGKYVGSLADGRQVPSSHIIMDAPTWAEVNA